MNNKIVFFNRSSVHYRKGIFELLEKELEVDFFFGDKRPGKIKPLDQNQLKRYKGDLKNIELGPFYYQIGVLKLLWKPYNIFITPGDTYCLSTWLLALLLKFTNKRIYFWTHGFYGRETWIRRMLKTLFFKLTDGLFLYSNRAKETMIELGFQQDKLFVIYNSLDHQLLKCIKENTKVSDIFSDHFNNTQKNIIFIGRLTTVKHLDLILQAVYNIKLKYEISINVTFIGDGSAKNDLVKKTDELNLNNNVWFYGETYDEQEIANLIYNADLCVSPGNVGLTAIHSLTYGVPVLTHNNFAFQGPEVEAINEGINGFFFEFNSLDSLVESIITWYNAPYNRDEMRNNCTRIIDSFYNPEYQIQIFKSVLTR